MLINSHWPSSKEGSGVHAVTEDCSWDRAAALHNARAVNAVYRVDRLIDRQTDGRTDGRVERRSGGQEGRQTDRQTDRPIDR